MNRVSHGTSAARAWNRSSAIGSRSTPMRIPAGPIRSAIRRACPPPPTVQSTAISPGRGSTRSISSPASTGIWVVVMSRSVAKARSKVGDTGEDLFKVLAIADAVPDLEALSGAGDHDLLLEAGVVEKRSRDHHAVGGVELGVKRGIEEEALELSRLRLERIEARQGRRRERVVGLRGPDRHGARRAHLHLV